MIYTRLLLGDLASGARVWVGLAVVAAGAAVALEQSVVVLVTASSTAGGRGWALYGIGGTSVTFTSTAVVIVVGSVGGLVVSTRQRTHGLWLVVGLTPRSVALVVVGQVIVVAAAGGLVGASVAAALTPRYLSWTLAGSLGTVHTDAGPLGIVGTAAVVVALLLLGSIRPVLRVLRTDGITVLGDFAPGARGMGLGRWVLTGVLLITVLAIGFSLRDRPNDTLETPLLLMAVLSAAALTASAPAYLADGVGRGAVLSTAVPWVLAVRRVQYAARRSTGAVNPVVVCCSVAGGLAASHAVEGLVRPDDLSVGGVLLVVGGALFVALVGSAATVSMAAGRRGRDLAVVLALGGGFWLLLRTALLEAVVLAGAGLVLSVVPVLVVSISVAVVAGSLAGVTALLDGFVVATVAAAAALTLDALATLLPTVLLLRGDPVASLRSE